MPAGELARSGRSQGHEYQDAIMYAKWGVDIEVRWCNIGTRNAEEAYATMRDALKRAAGRLYSACANGAREPWLWAKDTGNSWRTTGDIVDNVQPPEMG